MKRFVSLASSCISSPVAEFIDSGANHLSSAPQVHIMDQRELEKGGGPIGLVLAPTRELAEQIHKETRKFSKAYGACVGGLGG